MNMSACQIVYVDGQYGVYSFTTGYAFKPYTTLIEWAKKDFDSCFTYLFNNGYEDTAEELFDLLVKLLKPSRSH